MQGQRAPPGERCVVCLPGYQWQVHDISGEVHIIVEYGEPVFKKIYFKATRISCWIRFLLFVWQSNCSKYHDIPLSNSSFSPMPNTKQNQKFVACGMMLHSSHVSCYCINELPTALLLSIAPYLPLQVEDTQHHSHSPQFLSSQAVGSEYFVINPQAEIPLAERVYMSSLMELGFLFKCVISRQ